MGISGLLAMIIVGGLILDHPLISLLIAVLGLIAMACYYVGLNHR